MMGGGTDEKLKQQKTIEEKHEIITKSKIIHQMPMVPTYIYIDIDR